MARTWNNKDAVPKNREFLLEIHHSIKTRLDGTYTKTLTASVPGSLKTAKDVRKYLRDVLLETSVDFELYIWDYKITDVHPSYVFSGLQMPCRLIPVGMSPKAGLVKVNTVPNSPPKSHSAHWFQDILVTDEWNKISTASDEPKKSQKADVLCVSKPSPPQSHSAHWFQDILLTNEWNHSEVETIAPAADEPKMSQKADIVDIQKQGIGAGGFESTQWFYELMVSDEWDQESKLS